jgi:hypothetical protein
VTQKSTAGVMEKMFNDQCFVFKVEKREKARASGP